MLFWFPVQIYYIYRYFFDKGWKEKYVQKHWLYKGWVWFNILSGLWNLLQLLLMGLVLLGE
jgi:hypothetical protein